MPILFRCQNCGQKLSITRKKAGKTITCPECVHRIKVPVPQQLQGVADDAGKEDDPSEKLQIVKTKQAYLSDAEISAEWSNSRNPWLDEEEEDEDFSLTRAELDESGLDMTPMVDVTFLLLIFFMITASFSMQRSLETTPPEPDENAASQTLTMEDLEEESVVVEIDNEDNLRVDDVAVSGIGELGDVLRNSGKRELLIEAHPKATHGMVVAVTDIGIEVDMQRIRRVSRGESD